MTPSIVDGSLCIDVQRQRNERRPFLVRKCANDSLVSEIRFIRFHHFQVDFKDPKTKSLLQWFNSSFGTREALLCEASFRKDLRFRFGDRGMRVCQCLLLPIKN